MNNEQTARTIGALTAIVQTALPELYHHEKGAKEYFLDLVAADDALALAIANTLSEEEIDRAFAWEKRSHGGINDEMRAMPVIEYLTPKQRERVRRWLGEMDGDGDEAQ